MWGGCSWGAHAIVQEQMEDWCQCVDVLFLCDLEKVYIFLYIKCRMALDYINNILCIYQSWLKLLDCEIKNQVKHMCSFKNHIHKNTA